MEQKIEFDRIINFTSWVKKHYGYSVGKGIWEHSLQYELKMAILQKWFREEHNIDIDIKKLDSDELKARGIAIFSRNYKVGGIHIVKPDAIFVIKDEALYNKYEDALEKGLLESIKKI